MMDSMAFRDVITQFQLYMDSNINCGLLLLDLRKVFDTGYHGILLKILYQIGIIESCSSIWVKELDYQITMKIKILKLLVFEKCI